MAEIMKDPSYDTLLHYLHICTSTLMEIRKRFPDSTASRLAGEAFTISPGPREIVRLIVEREAASTCNSDAK